MSPNITPHTIPAMAPPLRPRFASWFLDTGKGRGDMSAGLGCDLESAEPEDIGRAAPKVAMNRSERSIANFILVFEFDFLSSL